MGMSVYSLRLVTCWRTEATPLLCSFTADGVIACCIRSKSLAKSSVPCTMLFPGTL